VKLLLSFLAALALSHSSRAAEFILKPNDVIAIVGGEDMLAVGEVGLLELYLHQRYPSYHLKIRNFAWEGDTVFEQPRMLNYPTLERQLEECGATVVILNFGLMESFAEPSTVDSFAIAYAKLVNRLRADGSRRVVIVSPHSLDPTHPRDIGRINPPKDTPGYRDVRLGSYVSAAEKVAKDLGASFVDVSGESPFTLKDGSHLSPSGHVWFITSLLWQLGIHTVEPDVHDWQKLAPLVFVKDRLWDRYRRPQNWAFLAGDRISQPSSRDHRDPSKRWFPEEMKEFIPLIEAKEREISELAAKLAAEKKN
jgi:GDSL-like Lipase/Acylhydrolase family